MMTLRFAALIFICATTHAADYYVSPAGSDAAPGTSPAEAFGTLAHAMSILLPGDTCRLMGGTYRETLTPVISGTADAPIVISAAPGEVVILTGADPVDGWTRLRGRVFRAPMDWDLGTGFNQVFANGIPLVEARYPNMGSADLLHPPLIPLRVTGSEIRSERLGHRAGYWEGAILVGGIGERWTFQCARVTESSPGILTVRSMSAPWFEGGGEGFLTGTMSALDEPGEWHHQDGYLHVVGRPRNVEAKRRAWCVDFNERRHVVVRGLTIRSGSVRMAGNSNTLEDCTVEYPSHFTYFPWSGYSADGGAEQGHNGILVRGTGNTIRGCRVSWSAGSGVLLNGKDNLVERTLIENIDYSGTYSCPVAFIGSGGPGNGGNSVRFCTIRNTGRDGIQMYGARGDEIAYNDISATGLLCHDTGLLYAWGADGAGTRITRNWIHDNLSRGIRPGIYLDNYCSGFTVDRNVIWNCEAGVRVNGPALGHRIYHNTLFRCDPVGSHTYISWPPPTPVLVRKWPENTYEYDAANNLHIRELPGLVLEDPDGFDFRLKAASRAIDAGMVIDGYTKGYSGEGPDFGAYELGSSYWRPGVDGYE